MWTGSVRNGGLQSDSYRGVYMTKVAEKPDTAPNTEEECVCWALDDSLECGTNESCHQLYKNI